MSIRAIKIIVSVLIAIVGVTANVKADDSTGYLPADPTTYWDVYINETVSGYGVCYWSQSGATFSIPTGADSFEVQYAYVKCTRTGTATLTFQVGIYEWEDANTWTLLDKSEISISSGGSAIWRTVALTTDVLLPGHYYLLGIGESSSSNVVISSRAWTGLETPDSYYKAASTLPASTGQDEMSYTKESAAMSVQGTVYYPGVSPQIMRVVIE